MPRVSAAIVIILFGAACGGQPDRLPTAIHLVDLVGGGPATISDTPAASSPARALWRFAVEDEAAAWQEGGGLEDVVERQGRLRWR